MAIFPDDPIDTRTGQYYFSTVYINRWHLPLTSKNKNTRESHWPERFDEETYVIVFNIATTWSPMQM